VSVAPSRPELRSRYRSAVAEALLTAAAVLLALTPAAAGDIPESIKAPGVLRGIDVSHHSGAVDWAQVKAAGFSFAYVKATEGVDDADPLFAANWQALKELGMPHGAYHFFVTEDDPEEQARFFLDHVELQPGDLVPVVDIELLGHHTPPGVARRLKRFLDLVQQEIGVRPMVYTMPNFWNIHFGAGFGEHPLWVAEYGVDEPRIPEDWEGWHLWQYAEDRIVPGVEKEADLSRIHPDLGLDSLRIDRLREAAEMAVDVPGEIDSP